MYGRRARELDDSLVVGKPEVSLFLMARKQPVWLVQAWSEKSLCCHDNTVQVFRGNLLVVGVRYVDFNLIPSLDFSQGRGPKFLKLLGCHPLAPLLAERLLKFLLVDRRAFQRLTLGL